MRRVGDLETLSRQATMLCLCLLEHMSSGGKPFDESSAIGWRRRPTAFVVVGFGGGGNRCAVMSR
jgi:hypothetical protein